MTSHIFYDIVVIMLCINLLSTALLSVEPISKQNSNKGSISGEERRATEPLTLCIILASVREMGSFSSQYLLITPISANEGKKPLWRRK